MTDAERAEQLARAGDVLAEMLGFTLAAMDRVGGFTDEQLAGGRRGIACWHRIRAIAKR